MGLQGVWDEGAAKGHGACVQPLTLRRLRLQLRPLGQGPCCLSQTCWVQPVGGQWVALEGKQAPLLLALSPLLAPDQPLALLRALALPLLHTLDLLLLLVPPLRLRAPTLFLAPLLQADLPNPLDPVAALPPVLPHLAHYQRPGKARV